MKLSYTNQFKIVVNDSPDEVSFLDLSNDIYLKFSGADAIVISSILSGIPIREVPELISLDLNLSSEVASFKLMTSIKTLIGHGIIKTL